MPKRRRRSPREEVLAKNRAHYDCPITCPANSRMDELFGLLTDDLVDEFKIDSKTRELKKVAPATQLVNGWQMRALIAEFISHVRDAIKDNHLTKYSRVEEAFNNNKSHFIGMTLGCLADLCFNLEYVRRINDNKWSYCNRHSEPRVYYPYLGICPRCVIDESDLKNAALGSQPASSEEESEDRRRYFGNKIKSHFVGRIGERILTFILDLVTKSYSRTAVTALVSDDQHDIDSVFFFDKIAVLSQIKASPLVLLPVVVKLTAPLTQGVSVETSLPLPRANHTFLEIATAGQNLELYLSLTDSTISLGAKTGLDFPYTTFRRQLNQDTTLSLLDNWFAIYTSFAIPKVVRRDEDIRRARLTAGWGAPIDDNKAKAGLARSDNMMKGTYACLKYGAYYAQECAKATIRTALIANIDPAHQYAEYLQKLEDIRWGHDKDFTELEAAEAGGITRQIIDTSKLTFLFDSVFTFNRQILNDADVRNAWDLEKFADKLISGELDEILQDWQQAQQKQDA